MITKQYVKSRRAWKVTFTVPRAELPPDIDVENVSVVGDFNDWAIGSTPLQYVKSTKSWKGVEYLPAGQTVQFRYVANGQFWFNDWHADGYTPGGTGEDNCLIQLPAPPNQ